MLESFKAHLKSQKAYAMVYLALHGIKMRLLPIHEAYLSNSKDEIYLVFPDACTTLDAYIQSSNNACMFTLNVGEHERYIYQLTLTRMVMTKYENDLELVHSSQYHKLSEQLLDVVRNVQDSTYVIKGVTYFDTVLGVMDYSEPVIRYYEYCIEQLTGCATKFKRGDAILPAITEKDYFTIEA